MVEEIVAEETHSGIQSVVLALERIAGYGDQQTEMVQTVGRSFAEVGSQSVVAGTVAVGIHLVVVRY